MNLNTAQDIRYGGTTVSAVYLGSTQIWAPHDYSLDYFTIEAITPGTVTIKKFASSSSSKTFSYSTDNGTTWTSATTTDSAVSLATLSVGQKILFKGTNTTYNRGLIFGGTAQTKVYGNIMSLLYEDNFVGQTTLSDTYTFYWLFYEYTNLISAENLILPATTLSDYCYAFMFRSCTSLTKAPELPATTLTESCYGYMFYNCTVLTKAPELPTTTLTCACYSCMFQGCTSLTTAPELPATILADHCYGSMFQDCTSLTKAPELPATTLANGCYAFMFRSCTSLTKAPELPATTLSDYCYSNMFYGCTSLTIAPQLPATTLVDSCYYYMFSGCTSLNYIKCLATDISAPYCTNNWVYGVASSGTFTKATSTTWSTGNNGIPSNWTIVDV